MTEPKPTKHHRKAKKFGGKGNPENISLVPEDKHQAFHKLFGCGCPFEIARVLNSTWINPSYYLLVRRRW